MIRLPINPLTPPARLKSPRTQKQQTDAAASKSGGGSYAGGATPDIPTFESLFQQMLRHYMPETVEFTPLSEDILSETIRNWLRPAYEQAIKNRRDQTQRINAELDADAWSRGMGQSTYLTDIKQRQFRGESQDVDTLESNYASELAGHLYDAMKEQQKMQIDVDRFNAEQINHANEQAMSAARALYSSYLSGTGSRGSSRRAAAETGAGAQSEAIPDLLFGAQENLPKTDYRTVVNAVARMAPAERRKLYDRSDPTYMNLRGEILYSIGPDAFRELMRDYPGA